ncbi:hypothetical protein J2X02_003717 [Pseudoxanthomonas japonensis]|uniref:hypothetical protein n=1 Tax=Pseudoxanthomonas japonensis TaxID=69284 RepID=UPI00286731BB|nr:hypothetical protein [Pseudoxanthomonas japonensis]MDR7070846.1 hypothetical protein [Pseudoxanthomonas japonensis]
MNKKIALGIVIAILFWIIDGKTIALLKPPISPVAQSFVVSLVGSGLGSYLAKRNFLTPAFAVWALCWALAIYMLYLIAAPTGQASVAGIIRYNVSALALSAFATLIGVLGGQVLAQRNQGVAAAT